ncbi:histone-lysine N-methyltransferase ATX2-like [Hibiscus syriacus]|uniref:Histone-lysine N-methyltransferase ATX2-like n=1 Tax=Hibiscus syriacus TaxID=106335 RepID=A0A6A3CYF8_HIBSY|nr:histone-lysine N-methyltransferase ATX2-like [Hibiscus syriacus]
MGNRNYSSQGGAKGGHGASRLKSQLSFTIQDSLSQISEVSENLVDGVNSNGNRQNAAHSFEAAGFGMDSWDIQTPMRFLPHQARGLKISMAIFTNVSMPWKLRYQSWKNNLTFSLPQTTLEMATVEQLLHTPEDSVPCKIRASVDVRLTLEALLKDKRATQICWTWPCSILKVFKMKFSGSDIESIYDMHVHETPQRNGNLYMRGPKFD